MPRILVVSGASRTDSHVTAVVEHTLACAKAAGGEVRLLDLAKIRLPLMENENETQAQLDDVRAVRSDAAWAQGFVLITPEYHGNMSGALKNWFDYLYLQLAGKFAGVIAVTGGGGGDMSLVSVRNSFNWCHGFTLPFVAAARASDFEDGALQSSQVRERIARIAHDVCRYAPVLHEIFEGARAQGKVIKAGFAGLHANDPRPD